MPPPRTESVEELSRNTDKRSEAVLSVGRHRNDIRRTASRGVSAQRAGRTRPQPPTNGGRGRRRGGPGHNSSRIGWASSSMPRGSTSKNRTQTREVIRSKAIPNYAKTCGKCAVMPGAVKCLVIKMKDEFKTFTIIFRTKKGIFG